MSLPTVIISGVKNGSISFVEVIARNTNLKFFSEKSCPIIPYGFVQIVGHGISFVGTGVFNTAFASYSGASFCGHLRIKITSE